MIACPVFYDAKHQCWQLGHLHPDGSVYRAAGTWVDGAWWPAPVSQDMRDLIVALWPALGL